MPEKKIPEKRILEKKPGWNTVNIPSKNKLNTQNLSLITCRVAGLVYKWTVYKTT